MRFFIFIFLFLFLVTMAQAQQKDPYSKEWKQVEAFQKKRLTKSAANVVDEIYASAKKKGQTEQIIKALMYKLGFMQYKEEDSDVKAIAMVQAELKTASFPAKPILHSILAELYQDYLEENQYRLYDRSATINFEQADLQTWGPEKLADAAIEQYMLSLAGHQDQAKKTPLKNLSGLLKDLTKENQTYWPTLYDFLAHRVVDGLGNDELDMHQPIERFSVNNPAYLAPAAEFAALQLTSPDSLSFKFYALQVLQDLTRFHLNDKDATALADVDLKRLLFVNENATFDNNSKLFFDALAQAAERYRQYPVAAEFIYHQAQYYQVATNDSTPNAEMRQLFKKAISLHPNSVGSRKSEQALSGIEKIEISFKTHNYLLPDEPVLTSISYKNITGVLAAVYRIPAGTYELFKYPDAEAKARARENEDEDDLWAGGRSRTKSGATLIAEMIAGLKPVAEKQLVLPDDQDFEWHKVQADLPGLPLGTYLIVLRISPGQQDTTTLTTTFVTVTNQSYLIRPESENQNLVQMLHRKTGTPLAGVQIQPFYSFYNSKTRDTDFKPGDLIVTDQDGKAILPLKKPQTEQRLAYLKTSLGTDTIIVAEESGGNYFREYKQDIPPKTFFFTDRAIYRPGQSIYFKGIQLRQETRKPSIISGAPVTVKLVNVNGEEVASQEFTTNAYGSFSGSFVLPVSMLNGNWQLTTENGSASFFVEDYKRPKFEVVFDTLKSTVKTGQLVKVTGNAKAFGGQALQQATVSYRVVREVVLPFYYGRYGSIKMPGYRGQTAEIKNGTLQTDDQGNFEITFEASPDKEVDKKLEPVFVFNIMADVTDLNGETQTGQTSIPVGYQALWLGATIPEKVNKTDKKDFELKATNAAGTPVAAQGSLTFYKLTPPDRAFRPRLWEAPDRFILSEEEFRRRFPNDVYRNEDDRKTWPAKKVKELEFNTGKSTKIPASLINNLELGYYVMELMATDVYGEKVSNKTYFMLFDAASKNLPYPQPNWFTPLATNIKSGEKARFLIGSSEKNVQVHYQVEYQHKIVLSRQLTLNQEQKIIEISVEPEWIGTAHFSAAFVKENRVYQNHETITISPAKTDLHIRFQSFRSKLEPGQKEQWKLIISGPDKEKVAAEMVATLYDASLDKFSPHQFSFQPFLQPYYRERFNWFSRLFGTATTEGKLGSDHYYTEKKTYPYLNWFIFNKGRGRMLYEVEMASSMDFSIVESSVKNQSADVKFSPPRIKKNEEVSEKQGIGGEAPDEKAGKPPVAVRKNFNETAFFQPHLQTNEKGEIIISFTVPEAITRWKMLGFAHTNDLKYGFTENELVTQKELMVMPNLPRFLRSGDRIILSAKIDNLAPKNLKGETILQLLDAQTLQPVNDRFGLKNTAQKIRIQEGKSSMASWEITVPEGVEAVVVRITAEAGKFSDGEEVILPVLTNRMLVTESLPVWVKGNQTKTFTLEKLKTTTSPTLTNHSLTLEFTQNPAWYAVQALPYLIEFPYECSEQVFSRIYANALAGHIANANPAIRQVFDSWKQAAGGDKNSNALLSNLQKNEELKALLLQETPWVTDGKNEAEQKQKLGILFDKQRLENEKAQNLQKLKEMQLPDGSFPWFKGMPADRYITQLIVAGFGKLNRLTQQTTTTPAGEELVRNAVLFMDEQLAADYEALKKVPKVKLSEKHLSFIHIQYFYARSFYPKLPVSAKTKAAYTYYLKQAATYWTTESKYMQGLLATSLHRLGNKPAAADIIKSLTENALQSEELGMYWKQEGSNWYWYQAPIERQAALIEAYSETGNRQQAVDDMKIWLLKQKQTQDWRTTRATADACYALLLRGSDWLKPTQPVSISLGSQKVETSEAKNETGTGYFKKVYAAEAVKPEMATVTVTKPDAGIAWGALYWQYFEQLDKITPADTPLKLNKKLFLQKTTTRGIVLEPVTPNTTLKPGDLLTVRVELRSDRAMDYVHLKDMRASGLEPVNVLSGYRYQGGLGYYESTRDAATNFFIGHLPKGTFVFEYSLRVAHAGDFSNGITSIQCMYAPEFSSHSEGIRVQVGK